MTQKVSLVSVSVTLQRSILKRKKGIVGSSTSRTKAFGLYWGDASDYKKLHLTVEDDEFAVDLGPFYSWWDRDRE